MAPRVLKMTAFHQHFAAPAFWIVWLAALALAGLLVWSVGARWWSLAVAVVVAPLALLLLTQAVTRD